jgi:hypothetical protein
MTALKVIYSTKGVLKIFARLHTWLLKGRAWKVTLLSSRCTGVLAVR